MSARVGPFGVRVNGGSDDEKRSSKTGDRVRIARRGGGWSWSRPETGARGDVFADRDAAWTDAATRNVDVPLGDFTGQLPAGVTRAGVA